MASLHSRGIIWGSNFQPKNICWVESAGRLKATCLESCALAPSSSVSDSINFLQCSFSPSSYTPPEVAIQLRRTRTGDLIEDVAQHHKISQPNLAGDYWSLGLTLLEIECGAQLIPEFIGQRAKTEEEILDRLADHQQLKRDVAAALADVSDDALRDLLDSLLDLSPEQRLLSPTPAEMLHSGLFDDTPLAFSPPHIPPWKQEEATIESPRFSSNSSQICLSGDVFVPGYTATEDGGEQRSKMVISINEAPFTQGIPRSDNARVVDAYFGNESSIPELPVLLAEYSPVCMSLAATPSLLHRSLDGLRRLGIAFAEGVRRPQRGIFPLFLQDAGERREGSDAADEQDELERAIPSTIDAAVPLERKTWEAFLPAAERGLNGQRAFADDDSRGASSDGREGEVPSLLTRAPKVNNVMLRDTIASPSGPAESYETILNSTYFNVLKVVAMLVLFTASFIYMSSKKKRDNVHGSAFRVSYMLYLSSTLYSELECADRREKGNGRCDTELGRGG